jgi:hypothetical protein
MKISTRILFIYSFWFFACSQEKKSYVVHKTSHWENGNIKSEGDFINDTIKEGLFTRHYKSGKLETEVNYHNNKRIGFLTMYFESGAIKLYQWYNRQGKNRFGVHFREDGKIEGVSGYPVVDTIFNKNNYGIGDTLKMSFIVAIPKNSKVEFRFYEDYSTKKNQLLLQVNEKEGTAKYEKIIHQKGVIKLGGMYTIKFNNGEKIVYETKERTLEIR